jgi:hypothetical protein
MGFNSAFKGLMYNRVILTTGANQAVFQYSIKCTSPVRTTTRIGRSVEFHNPPGFSLLGMQQATRNLKFMLLYLHHFKYWKNQHDFLEMHGRTTWKKGF